MTITNGLRYFRIENFDNGSNVGGTIADTVDEIGIKSDVTSQLLEKFEFTSFERYLKSN